MVALAIRVAFQQPNHDLMDGNLIERLSLPVAHLSNRRTEMLCLPLQDTPIGPCGNCRLQTLTNMLFLIITVFVKRT